MCSIAAHTLAGQDFGGRSFMVEFDMLAPGKTESSITNALVACYGRFSGPENSLDHFTKFLSLGLAEPPCTEMLSQSSIAIAYRIELPTPRTVRCPGSWNEPNAATVQDAAFRPRGSHDCQTSVLSSVTVIWPL